jgi:hypothetical protein
MSTLTRLLVSLGIIGLLAGTYGSATFATFSAQTDNAATFLGGTVAMTNVAGTVVSGANCSTETSSGVCATIFNATALKPGAADRSNTVAITYTGTLATSDFRLFAQSYLGRTGSSSALCTAATPAAKLNFQIKQGATVVFPVAGTGYGTLDAFATTYSSAANGLQLKGGSGTPGAWSTSDAATFTIAVNLDPTADNTYQGCQSQTSLAWYAVQ